MKKIFLLILFLIIQREITHAQVANLSGVVNQYTRVTTIINSCQIRVSDPQLYALNDQVLIIQMKGAVIDKSNTAAFGTLTNLNQAGLFEFNYIDSIHGDTITLAFQLKSPNYDVNARIQMVSVPTYDVININGTIYPRSWDGFTGGIVVMEARDSIIMNNNINADSAGFKPGVRSSANYTCNIMDYSFSEFVTPYHGGYKGESFVVRDNLHVTGRGAYATGGGGGNNHNTGGAGGANMGSGGLGGKQSFVNSTIQGCNDTVTHNGGRGGYAFSYATYPDRVFPGGGGGGGHQNDLPVNGGGEAGMGGAGGGVVILVSPQINANNTNITANGANVDSVAGRDGAGGGGAGGSILIYSEKVNGSLNLEVKGGKGGNNNSHNNLSLNLGGSHGTGGGGGGGYVGFGKNSVPANITMTLTGGNAGKIVNTASHNYNGTYGASAGTNGGFRLSVPLPRTALMCTPSAVDARTDIDSVAKDGSVTVKVKLNDIFNRATRVKICNPPKNGIATVNNFDSITYVPNTGFTGKDSILYCLCTKLSPEICDSAYVFISIKSVKLVALKDAAQTYINTDVLIPVLNNDTINVVPSVSLRINPLFGTAVWNGTGFDYTPNNGFIGIDSFSYRICSNTPPLTCDSAWVVVKIDRGVEANNDFATTRVNTPVIIRPKVNDDLTLVATISILEFPKHGTVQILNGDSVRYNPQTAFYGQDTIKYRICSVNPANVCDSAYIYISVFPPLNAIDDQAQTNSGRLVGIKPINNDTTAGGYTISILTGPKHGSAVKAGADSIYYASDPGYAGPDSIVYLLCSQLVPNLCDTAIIRIQVLKQVNAVNDTTSTLEDVAKSIYVKQNDQETEPASVLATISPKHGVVTVMTNDTVVYTPSPDFNGIDSFQYSLCTKASPEVCDTAWVFITVTPVNDPPLAVFDTATTYRNKSRIIPVLANDIEPDGDSLILGLLTQPANGVVTRVGSEFLYKPNKNYVGTDRFRYYVCDDASPALCDSTDVFINVLERKSLEVPNGISPNGDGINDTWVVDGIDLVPDNQVLILNRWGEVVWEMNNYDNSWAGVNKKGEPLPDGTYFFVIRSNQEDEIIKGFIVIQR